MKSIKLFYHDRGKRSLSQSTSAEREKQYLRPFCKLCRAALKAGLAVVPLQLLHSKPYSTPDLLFLSLFISATFLEGLVFYLLNILRFFESILTVCIHPQRKRGKPCPVLVTYGVSLKTGTRCSCPLVDTTL